MIRALLVLLLALAGTARAEEPGREAQEAEAKRKLEAVREEQRALGAASEATRGEQRQARAALRAAELEVGRLSRELARLDAEIATRQASERTLGAEAEKLSVRLKEERAALAALLRSAYLEGRGALWKQLFAPERVADVERLLAYQRYVERAREARIRAVVADLAREQDLTRELANARAALETDRAARTRDAETLAAERARRAELLGAVEARLTDQQARLAELAADEKALLALLAKLRDAIADIPKLIAGSEPFAGLRGKLGWPLLGRVVEAYGQKLPNGLQSHGVLISSTPGNPVAAVAYGRVAYADWLKGYGLIAILDHGDGYLTLYAHCESLLKDVGDWVRAGEPIAHAGASGSRRESGVYFELRKDGQVLDPMPWFTKR